jgi:hypothetical protein
MTSTNATSTSTTEQAISVHYMAKGYSCHGASRYLFTDADGHHAVDAIDVPTEKITEWVDATGRTDAELLAEVYTRFQNGIVEFTGEASISEELGVRSMMVGDVISINRREYAVAAIGFERYV